MFLVTFKVIFLGHFLNFVFSVFFFKVKPFFLTAEKTIPQEKISRSIRGAESRRDERFSTVLVTVLS